MILTTQSVCTAIMLSIMITTSPMVYYKPHNGKDHMEIAKEYIGYGEDSRLNEELARYTTFRLDTRVTPWCAAFVALILSKAGYPYIHSLMAKDYLKYGHVTDSPHYGDIVVFNRGNDPALGHVAFFVRFEGKNVIVLGGNQDNTVKYKAYPISRVVGYRRI